MGMLVNPYVSGAAAPVSFGYVGGEGSGTSVQTGFNSEIDFTSYTNGSGSTCNVKYVDLLYNKNAQVGANLFVGIYSDTGNAPNVLLGTSATLTSYSTGTVTLTFASTVPVTNGTKIWVAMHCDFNFFQDNGNRADDGRFRYKTGTTLSNPAGATTSYALIIPATLRSA